MKYPVYQKLANLLQAKETCIERSKQDATNPHWLEQANRHKETIASIVKTNLPSGSGFDNGTKLDENSKPNRLIFNTSYHHMNDTGYYIGWTDHQVIVTPSLVFGFDVRVTGINKRGIKEHIANEFVFALREEIN